MSACKACGRNESEHVKGTGFMVTNGGKWDGSICLSYCSGATAPLTGAQLAAKHGFKPLSPEAHRANVSREVRTVVAQVDEASETPCARCGKAFPWFATPEEARDSIACCDACHERVAFDVDEEAREQVKALRVQLAAAQASRAQWKALARAANGELAELRAESEAHQNTLLRIAAIYNGWPDGDPKIDPRDVLTRIGETLGKPWEDALSATGDEGEKSATMEKP